MVKTLTSQLWECINSTEYSFKNDPLPVFYVLYACYCKVDILGDVSRVDPFRNAIFSKDEWNESKDLFSLIESKAKDSFEKNKDLFHKFYRIISGEFNIIKKSGGRNDYDAYVFHYKQIIEFFIEQYLSLSDVVRPADSKGYNELIACLIASTTDERYMYEYGAGCGSLALEKHNWYIDDYLGYEPDEVSYIISKIRLNAHHISLDSVTNDSPDSNGWCFYSFPKFDPNIIEKALDECIWGERYSEIIITLPMDFCYSPKYETYRSTIMEKNLLDYIIYLPKGTFVGYDKESIILCLCRWDEKKPYHTDIPEYFTVIDGRKILKAGRVDFPSIERIIWDEVLECDPRTSSSPRIWRNIPINEETRKLLKDNLLLQFWMAYMDRIEHSDDYTMVEIKEICEIATPLENPEVQSAIVLDDTDFVDVQCCDMPYQADLKIQSIPGDYVGYQGRSLVLELNDDVLRFCIVDSDEVFFTSADHVVFTAKQPITGNWEYLSRCVLLSHKGYGVFYSNDLELCEFAKEHIDKPDFLKDASVETRQMFMGLSNLTGDGLKRFAQLGFLGQEVYMLSDKDAQESYIQSLYEEFRKAQIRDANEKTNIAAMEASADIAHMLGLSFNEIVDCAKSLEGISEVAKRRSDCIIANIDYMKRVLNTFGTDFDGYESVLKCRKINGFVKHHLDSWSRLSRAIFKIEFDSSLLEDVEVNFDEMLFSIMFDAILENARRHGFGKADNPDNLVKVHTRLSDDGNFIVLTVCNNGKALPDGFSLQKFVTKGLTIGNSGNTGIGGYHIYQIVKRHHGKLGVYSNEKGHTVVEIHIPIK